MNSSPEDIARIDTKLAALRNRLLASCFYTWDEHAELKETTQPGDERATWKATGKVTHTIVTEA